MTEPNSEALDQIALNFAGNTFDPEFDGQRLASQLVKVRELMQDRTWRTLAEIQKIVGGSEAGISARLRDLRKAVHGKHVVERQRRGDPKNGLHEYRLVW